MKMVILEMPMVTKCLATTCAYNRDSNCHARAITVGDEILPGCDTFLQGSQHAKNAEQVAGVGACKTTNCKYNDDLECTAESIHVGVIKNQANCMTFALR